MADRLPQFFYRIRIRVKGHSILHHFCDETDIDLVKVLIANLRYNPEVTETKVTYCNVGETDLPSLREFNWVR